jgi:hypothetical protein
MPLTDDIVWMDFATLERFMVDVFKGLGVHEEDAKICADVLIASDKKGIDTHWVNRLKPTYYDRLRAGLQSPVTRIEVVREGPTIALFDGNGGMGHVIAKRAMALLHRGGPGIRHGDGGSQELYPLRHRRLLSRDGRRRRDDRYHGHQRKALRGPHFRLREHAGHQPPSPSGSPPTRSSPLSSTAPPP